MFLRKGFETRIEELIALRAQIKEIIADWDAALDTTADGERAHLLEKLK